MRGRRIAALLFSLVCMGSVLRAQDWGVELGSSFGVSRTAETAVNGALGPAAWFTAPLWTGTQLAFRLNFSYRFSTDPAEAARFPAFPYMFDPVELRISARLMSADAGRTGLGLALGRFTWSDPTGIVFSHRLDGAALDGRFAFGSFELLAGYTGLMWASSSSIVLSRADVSQPDDALLGPPRLIGSLTLRSPALRGNTVFLSGLAQKDFTPADRLAQEGGTEYLPDRGGAVDTLYVSAGAAGTPIKGLSYSGFFTLGTGRVLSFLASEAYPAGSYSYSQMLGYLAGLSARYAFSGVMTPTLALRLLFRPVHDLQAGHRNPNRSGFLSGARKHRCRRVLLFAPAVRRFAQPRAQEYRGIRKSGRVFQNRRRACLRVRSH
jgi:hypothetical protein